MREYKIDLGNSSTGPIGAVAYIKARSKAEALALFNEAATFHEKPLQLSSLVKCNVYFNPKAITLKDVSVVR